MKYVIRTMWVVALMLHWSAEARADWTRFRGPNGQGRAEAADLPVAWDEEKNVAWKTALPGVGWSSPVVLGEQVWVTAALDEGRSLRALCVDVPTGRLMQNVEVFAPDKPPGINERNTHASPTPVIEAGRVYVHFGNMGTACLATDTGEILWRNQDLKFKLTHGPASSPILFGDLLIVQFDGPAEKLVVALDKNNGNVVWQRHRSAPYRENTLNHQAHTTPILVDHNDSWQLITVAADQTHAYDPRTGEELWHVRYQGFANVACPIVKQLDSAAGGKSSDRLAPSVYIITGFGSTELWNIRIDGRGDVTDRNVLWKARRQMPKLPTPVLVDDQIYMVSDQGVACCLNAKSGEQVWQERIGGNYSASPVCGDGKVYFASEEGKVAVVQTGSQPQIVGENRMSGIIKATPAIVGRAIYVRTDLHLYRIENASPATGRQS